MIPTSDSREEWKTFTEDYWSSIQLFCIREYVDEIMNMTPEEVILKIEKGSNVYSEADLVSLQPMKEFHGEAVDSAAYAARHLQLGGN